MKRNKDFLFGFLSAMIVSILCFLFFITRKQNKFEYVKLNEDYIIRGVGNIKSGTIVRIDQHMSEGFTRYILYLNMGGDKSNAYQPKHSDQVIPYWLEPIDTLN